MEGRVIPEQVAFIVDKYLLDNKFSSTRLWFRDEASSIFANNPNYEAPKNLMTLTEMLEDYINLKKQKIMIDQEKAILKQQKDQNQKLFEILARNAMTTYKAGGNIPQTVAKSTSMAVPQPPIRYKSRRGVATTFVQNKFYTEFQPPQTNSNVNSGNNSTSSIVNVSGTKRKDITSAMDVPSTAKKPCYTSSNLQQEKFYYSVTSQSDKNAPCVREVMPTSNYNMLPSKRVMATPTNQAVTKEMGHCIPAVMTNSDKPSNCNRVEIMRSFDSDDVPESLSNLNVISNPAPKEINNDSSNTNMLNPGPGLSQQFYYSGSSQSDKITPCDREVMPTSNYKMMPSKRVMATPTKQTVSVEMSHCIPPVMTNSDKPSNCDPVEIMRSFDSDEVPDSLSNQLVEINNDSMFDLYNIDDDDLYNQIDFTR